MPRPRALLAAVLTILLAGAGCTSGPEGPTAARTAEKLAQAITDGRFAAVSFDGRTPAQVRRWWATRTEGLGGITPKVAVAEVSEDGDAARATLSYVWKLTPSGTTWAYRATGRLERGADDAWRVHLEPALLMPDLRRGERLRVDTEPADRADILGAGDAKLMTERRVLRFGIDKTKVGPPRQQQSARRLADLVGVDAKAFADRVAAAGEKAFVEAIVLREADVTTSISAGYEKIPGALPVPDRIPLAPTREFARPILGTVGPVTAEIVEKADGAYRPGDQAGLSGLEQRYDEQLRGTPGIAVHAVRGDRARELFDSPAVPGEPLRTTLDTRLQRLAEQLLAGVRPASAIVALRPSSGDVLVAASGPGSNGYSTATLGQYAPGSTFKVVSSLALLRAGLTATSAVGCPATTVVDGKSFKNYDDYPPGRLGSIDLRTALANSCNTAFIGERDTVSQADLADAAASLGLGVDHDLGFPAYLGAVPDQAGSETEHAASLIGQGKVVASPLAMAAVVASVRSGATVVPRLLPDLAVDRTASAAPLRAEEAAALRALMRAVVTEGSASFLAGLPGGPVIAKTGTAEFGSADPPRTHAWMVAARGDLAVAVFVDVGRSGSGTAGPLLEAFLRAA